MKAKRVMHSNDTFFISRYGFKSIAVVAALFLVTALFDCGLFEFIFFVLLAITVYIFRNPERSVPHYEKGSVVAVCDGIVSDISTSDDKTVVTIDSKCHELGVLRSPIDCTVSEFSLLRGAMMKLSSTLAKTLNENASVTFTSADNQKVMVSHQLSNSMLPLRTSVNNDTKLSQSERYGFVLEGTTQITLPSSARIHIEKSAKVRAGETLIAYL